VWKLRKRTNKRSKRSTTVETKRNQTELFDNAVRVVGQIWRGVPKAARPDQPATMPLCSGEPHRAIVSRLVPSGSSRQCCQSNTLKLAFEVSTQSHLCFGG
jgi:hypothetical protein